MLATRSSHRSASLLIILTVLLAGTMASSHAAIIHPANQGLVSGGIAANPIDPGGDEDKDIEATGATPEATLNALTDLRVQQDFDTGISTSDSQHVFSWTDSDLPDYRMTRTSTNGFWRTLNATGGTTNRRTSPLRNMDLDVQQNAGTSATFVVVIDFGNYNAVADSFDPTVNHVRAAGFMLTDASFSSSSFVVNFYSDTNSLLSTQSAAAGTDSSGGRDIYFGWLSSTHNIDRMELVITHTGNLREQYGIDDVAFTTIPEPASFVLAAAGLMLLASRRARTPDGGCVQ